MRDTYIIIPVYNERPVVDKVISKVLKVCPNVVCVDDGSGDGSAEVIKRTEAHLVRHPINLGQGAALQTGIDFALQDPRAKYFVTFDADGQHDLDDVRNMLSHLKNKKLDIVLGSRFLGHTENMSLMKKWILKLAILFSNVTTGTRLSDAHNGLRVFDRHVAENMRITMPDMAHASEIIHLIAANKFKYEEFPVTIAYTDYSKSKGQSMLNAINITFDLMLRKMGR